MIDFTQRLPAVIRVDGILAGKTGWNSDREIACYRTDCRFAHDVNSR